ncbi:MAG TPA: type 4a pilus biogenesis protein PilO [Gemmatimonadaceae bacterium]|nr:type 4a pilus biogenesis protein PilO [Gemmatimonadaceae bacterium]
MALLPSTKREQYMVIAVLFFLAIATVYYMYYHSPREQELAVIEEHLEKLNAQNQRAKAELARGSVNELRAQAQRYAQHLQVMRQLVPTSNEVPALLEQISTAARRVGLELAGVQPGERTSGELFDTYRYNMQILADYHAFGQFLTNVGSLARIVAPANVKITVPTNTQVKKLRPRTQALIEARFEIQTYVARTSPGAEPAGQQ